MTPPITATPSAPTIEAAATCEAEGLDSMPNQQHHAQVDAFTYGGYQTLISCLRQADYRFATFDQAEHLLKQGARFALMRHDIDMCLTKALDLAALEASLGVTATYFFLVRTDHYNIFSAEDSAKIRQLLQLGHRLGLHFDCAAYPQATDVNSIARQCQREAHMLETWFDTRVEIVSFHRPSEIVLSGNPRISAPLPHTYSEVYAKQLHYCSDSQGRWRYGNPLRQPAFPAGAPMQILTHPIWWNKRSLTPLETLRKFVKKRGSALEMSLAQNCKVFPQPRRRAA